MSEKIAIIPIHLKNQKPTDVKESFLELHDTYVHYHIEFFADEPKDENDVELGWDNVYSKYDIIAFKKNVAGLEKSFTKDKKWGVYIILFGFQHDIKFYYRSQEKAQEMYDKIFNWLITK